MRSALTRPSVATPPAERPNYDHHAFSPSQAAHGGGSSRGAAAATASSSAAATAYLDASRTLPTAVRFVVKTLSAEVGSAGPGAVLGLQQCLRGQGSPFSVVAAEPGCTLLYFSKKYLALVPSEESLRYGAPPNPLLATILSDGAVTHTVRALGSLGACLTSAHAQRVGQELVAEAALARVVAGDARSARLTSASLRAHAKEVALSVASKDPAVLLSLLPMGAEEVQRIIWTMVAKLADEVHSDRFGRAGSAAGGLNLAQGGGSAEQGGGEARAVAVGSPHASYKTSTIAGALFARAPEAQ